MTFVNRSLGSGNGLRLLILAVLAPVLPVALRAQTRAPLQQAPPTITVTPPGISASSASAPESPALAAAATMDTPLGQSSTSYIIGPGDILQVTVWKEPAMSAAGVPVRPDGMISLPLVGDVQATNQTPMSLSQSIEERLKQYVRAPLVTVTVSSIQPKEIFLAGEVAHVGPIILTAQMTPLQAIVSAGGVTGYAKTKAIYILRRTSDGRQQKIPFNYRLALKTGDMQHVFLLAGDTIVVP